ncbi:MAG: VOC family protein, partial [Luminiphilus sp.]
MKFLHTMIRASNLDDTLDFFCNKLGLQEVNRYD